MRRGMDTRGRSLVFLSAMVQVFGLSPFRARLRDVSQGGCKLVTGTPLRPDEIVLITLPVVGEIIAYVVWSQRGMCGLRFERPIDADRLTGRDGPIWRRVPSRPMPLAHWRPTADQ